jgi:glycosyltransferase involved in cell wall biosynthesis
LHAALAALLDDEAQRRRLGEAASRRAQALTWGRSAAQFRALLDKLEAA